MVRDETAMFAARCTGYSRSFAITSCRPLTSIVAVFSVREETDKGRHTVTRVEASQCPVVQRHANFRPSSC